MLDCGIGKFQQQQQQDSTCALCDASCRTCRGPSAFDCLTCVAPQLRTPEFHNCVDQCAKGFYAFADTAECLRCNAECQTCRGPEATDCLSCTEGRVLTPSLGTCGDACLPAYYDFAGQCHECSAECATCFGSTAH